MNKLYWNRVWWLIWNAFVRIVVASDSRTKRQSVRCRTFVLSPTMHAKRRVVVRVFSRCHNVARLKSKDWLISQATGRQRIARQCNAQSINMEENERVKGGNMLSYF
jgi:hypothetical protein